MALVTHGGCANSLIHALLGLPADALQFFELANGAISHAYLVPEAARLRNPFYPPFATEIRAINDTAHLGAPTA